MDKSNFVKQQSKTSKNSSPKLTEKVLQLLMEAKDESEQGNLNDSLAILNHCAMLTPDFEEVYLATAEVYRQHNMLPTALFNLNKAVDLNPNNPLTYIQRGEIFRKLRQYEASLNDLDKAIKLDPRNPLALGRRGTVYRHIKEFSKSLDDYNRAIALDKSNSWLYGNRAETYRELKEYRKAVNDYTQVLALNPKLNWVYGRRSFAYLWLGDIDLAHSDFERSWQLNYANLLDGWMAEWTALCKTPFPFSEEVKERLVRLVEYDQQPYVAYLCRAIGYWLEGDLTGSYEELDEACNLKPRASDAYFWKGVMAAGLGRDSEALALIEKALELGMPPILLSPLSWLETANPTFYKKYGQAILAKVIQKDNGSPVVSRKVLPVTQARNVQDEANDSKTVAKVNPPPPESPMDKTAQFLAAQPSYEDTIRLVKPLVSSSSPDNPLSETSVFGNKKNGVEEVTQSIKLTGLKPAPPEPLTTPPEISAAEQPLKPEESSRVEEPAVPPEAKPVEQPLKAPQEKVNPAVKGIRKIEPKITSNNLRIIPREGAAGESIDKSPEFIPTNSTNQSDQAAVNLEKQSGPPVISNKQLEIEPPGEENNKPVAPVKNRRFLLLATVGAGLLVVIIAVLLMFVLLLNRNENKVASNKQAAVSITATSASSGSEVAAVPPTAPTSGAVPGTPTPVSTIISSPTSSTGLTQAAPGALAISVTPAINNTTTSSLNVSSTTQSSTTPPVPTTATLIPPSPTVISTATPTQVPLLPVNNQPITGHTGIVTTASWTRDGRYYLTASEDKTIKVWDATTNQLVRTLDDKTRPTTQAITAARWSDDSQFILSGSADKYVRLYMVLPKQNISKAAVGSVLVDAADKVVPQAVGMAPDNSLFLYVGPDVVHSWSMNEDNQGPDFVLNSPGAEVTALVFTGDSKYLAIGLSTGVVQLWDIKANKMINSIVAGQAGGPVTTLEWLPGEKHLVVSYREALNVYSVNLSDGAGSISSVVKLPVKIKANVVAISPDGKRVAVGSQTGQVELWSFDSKKLINEFNISNSQLVSAQVVGLHWSQAGTEISVVGGGTKPFIATYRIALS